MLKLIRVNVFLGFVFALGLYYNVRLFGSVDLALYGRFTMILVYMNFLQIVAFSPFSQGSLVFYRETNDFKYIQYAIYLAVGYGVVYFIGGILLLLALYHPLGGIAYLLPLGFALAPINQVLRELMIVEDRLVVVNIIDSLVVLSQIVCLEVGRVDFDYLFILYFVGAGAGLFGMFCTTKMILSERLLNVSVLKQKEIWTNLWKFARPLLMARTVAPFYKNGDRAIYSMFITDSELGLLNFMISMFAKIKRVYKSWFSLRLPHLYKDAWQHSLGYLVLREMREARPLIACALVVFGVYLTLYMTGFITFIEERWILFSKYALFLAVPVLFQIGLGMTSSILTVKKHTTAMSLLSIFSIVSFLAIASVSCMLFQFDGAFFATMIYRESYVALAPLGLIGILNVLKRRKDKQGNH